MKTGKRSVDSGVDLKVLRLEAGSLQRPGQLSRPEMVAVAIWSGAEGLIPEMTRR